MVSVRVTATGRLPRVEFHAQAAKTGGDTPAQRSAAAGDGTATDGRAVSEHGAAAEREVWFGEPVLCPVIGRHHLASGRFRGGADAPPASAGIAGATPGPFIVEEMDCTVVVPPGWSATLDERGFMLMARNRRYGDTGTGDTPPLPRPNESAGGSGRTAGGASPSVVRTDAATFEVVKNSLYAVAEEMKVVLAKTAYSPILKVAGDYSCGVFDARGNMVAQGPDPQVPGPMNAPLSVTASGVFAALKTAVDSAGVVPPNSGAWRPIEVLAPEGTVVNATYPAPVVYANHEISHRVCDMVFGALASFMPDRVMACSQGTSAVLTLGGVDYRTEERYVSYETVKCLVAPPRPEDSAQRVRRKRMV